MPLTWQIKKSFKRPTRVLNWKANYFRAIKQRYQNDTLQVVYVPDQFALRTGVFLAVKKVHGLGFSLGGRIEGVPIRDILGKSEGFCRPGYAVSVEPGVSYMLKNVTASLNIPVALVRNRTRSLTDIADSTPTNFRHGDAAFADYLLNFGLVWRIPKLIASPFNLKE